MTGPTRGRFVSRGSGRTAKTRRDKPQVPRAPDSVNPFYLGSFGILFTPVSVLVAGKGSEPLTPCRPSPPSISGHSGSYTLLLSKQITWTGRTVRVTTLESGHDGTDTGGTSTLHRVTPEVGRDRLTFRDVQRQYVSSLVSEVGRASNIVVFLILRDPFIERVQDVVYLHGSRHARYTLHPSRTPSLPTSSFLPRPTVDTPGRLFDPFLRPSPHSPCLLPLYSSLLPPEPY